MSGLESLIRGIIFLVAVGMLLSLCGGILSTLLRILRNIIRRE